MLKRRWDYLFFDIGTLLLVVGVNLAAIEVFVGKGNVYGAWLVAFGFVLLIVSTFSFLRKSKATSNFDNVTLFDGKK